GYRSNYLRKDRTPRSRIVVFFITLQLEWDPSRLELVTDEMVDKYFSKVGDDEWKDLVLPSMLNSSTSVMAKL
ncbi:hypothetical protein MKX03_015927, partial [Papaver bracteatum]